MNGAAPRRIWLCADDYGISPGVNRAIRDLIERGRLNATSVMMVGPSIGRDEAASLQAAAAQNPRCAIGLHATLTAPFRPLTMHFLARSFVAKGDLKKLIDSDGVKGVTSNPSIFEKAIGSSDEYDAPIGQALKKGDGPVADLFENLAAGE